MNQVVSKKDLIFIALFSMLVFFGTLFLFSSLKDVKKEKHVSIRAIDSRMNKKINKRIQNLETKNKIFKSKILTSEIEVDNLNKEGFSKTNNKFELDVFENKAPEIEFDLADNAADKVRDLLESESDQAGDGELKLEQYKAQMIKKARSQGWAITINDDLAVTSAKPL